MKCRDCGDELFIKEWERDGYCMGCADFHERCHKCGRVVAESPVDGLSLASVITCTECVKEAKPNAENT